MAKYELTLPRMGESVEEATIINWLKNEGDFIQVDDLVVEIATDKVDSEVPSDVTGDRGYSNLSNAPVDRVVRR